MKDRRRRTQERGRTIGLFASSIPLIGHRRNHDYRLVESMNTSMSSVLTHGTWTGLNGLSSSHISHISQSQDSPPAPSFSPTQTLSSSLRTDFPRTLTATRALLEAEHDDDVALWGHVQVLRVEGSIHSHHPRIKSRTAIRKQGMLLLKVRTLTSLNKPQYHQAQY